MGTHELLPIVLCIVCTVFSCYTSAAFYSVDNYLINCGSQVNSTVYGRVFVPDTSNPNIFSPRRGVVASVTSNTLLSAEDAVLYRTARILTRPSSYKFTIAQRGMHWIRLYFFPFVYRNYIMRTFRFTVSIGEFALLQNFRAENDTTVFKEYLVNITSNSLDLHFAPWSNSSAFINALEIVSAPDGLIPDDARLIHPLQDYSGLLKTPLETIYRINMGGPLISPLNDSLARTWVPDDKFLRSQNLATSVIYGGTINYLQGGATQETAPNQVYATCKQMNAANVSNARFNVTWDFPVDPSFTCFIRLHFCDIVSLALNQLSFNVYINGWSVLHNFGISSATVETLAAPIYRDFVATGREGSSGIRISIGPSSVGQDSPNAILNGLEIMKINISGDRIHRLSRKAAWKKVLGIGLGSVGALVLIILAAGICIKCRRKNLKGEQHSRTWIPFSMTAGSKFSNGTLSTASGITSASGFHFPLLIILEATNNFDEDSVIGVGGFGKVYQGILRDGTKVAVKRGNSSSQQGLREFRTEIEMLTNFRHRHLVALIGYCDERNEMILVYEYMENGPLKKHLYGSDLPCLTWKQRLQICIGSARGLHYLHTGSVKPIIHRDVKSANILLDENFLAKVADFGLSKAGPELDQTHVSTAVKGSFGYLDPEYFRRQQLTEKSDVYSFGVVLLEVLCGRPVIDPTLPREMVSLPEWGLKWQKGGHLEHIIDPRLIGQVGSDSLRKFGDTFEKCLAEYGVDRPAMGDVLWNLEYALQLQEALCESQDSTNRIAEIPTGLGVVANTETVADDIDVPVDLDDLSGVSMRRVFSQLVKSEGR